MQHSIRRGLAFPDEYWESPRLMKTAKRVRSLVEKIDFDSHSMYPHHEHKTHGTMVEEMMELFKRNEFWDFNNMVDCYFKFGLDRIDRSIDQYIGEARWFMEYDRINGSLAHMLEYKNILPAFLSAYGLASTYCHGWVNANGMFFASQGGRGDIVMWLKSHPGTYFVKPIAGTWGEGAFKLTVGRQLGGEVSFVVRGHQIDSDEVRGLCCNHCLEDVLKQHPGLNVIAPNNVCAVRIVTLWNDQNGIDCISSLITIGRGESDVSNALGGGIAAWVDIESGCIKGKGLISLTDMKGFYDVHPELGIRFDGFAIPLYGEAKALAMAAHEKLPAVYCVGWDIAITEDGPVIIEGNRRTGMDTVQAILPDDLRNYLVAVFHERFEKHPPMLDEY